MTDTASAGGLMPHQKDEHDIWICKDCGWKYPNAKPSPKIRKNHKKHCSGKAGTDVHDAGSSDDAASDDEHHSSRKEGVAPNQTAEDSPVPTVESKNRSFDFAAATAKEDVNAEAPPPAVAVNGNAKEEAADGDVSTPATAEKQYEKVEVEDKKAPSSLPVSASPSGLMPHQKDEHDIWICKDCGWKYPNAKPSAKVRKHHKKQCKGKGDPGVGGSSDEASDDEHHHVQHDNVITRDVKSEEQPEISSKDDLNKPRSFEAAAASEEAKDTSQNKGKEESSSGTPPATVVDGLMPHQKDENDIWTCKDCGWKYPNAKPSSKVRKHHKKQCTGKGQPHGGEGSSDEASDDEHHHGHHDHLSPVAPARLGEAENGSGASGAAEPAPKISREFTKETPSSEVVKQESTAAEEALSIAAEPSPEPAELERASPEEIGDKEVPELKTEEQPQNSPAENLNKPASSKAVTFTAETKDTSEIGKDEEPSSGLMPHQKDENDIWICKDCGWKYPNAKPSGKVRKHHKKQCSGKGGPKVGGGSSDEGSDDEHHHRHLPTPAAFKESPSSDIVNEEGTSAEAPAAISRDIDFKALKESGSPEAVKEGSTVPEAGPPIAATEVNDTSEEIKTKEDSSTGTSEAAVVGGLMPHQKDEHDIWICKDCGWKYPNAKPSGKVRKHHKKQCPGKGGSMVGGGSSDEASDDEHHHGHRPTPAAFKESPNPDIVKEEDTSAEASSATSREIDFGALKESANPEAVKEESTVAEAGPPVAAPEEVNDTSEEIKRKEDSLTGNPEAAEVGGLMPHQKDEHDIWICKDCGWKYPNAKPSGKVRKHHKKQCPGKEGSVVGGGSSDEASDDERHHGHLPTPPAFKESPSPDIVKEGGASAEAPAAVSRDIDFEALKESANPEAVKEESTAAEAGPPIAEAGTQKDADTFGEESTKRPGDTTAGAVSFKDAILKETKMEGGDPKKPVSLREAIDKESKQEMESGTKSERTEATVAPGGLMPHQKDEADVWVCKACGWKYPNAKPSPKIKKNHKKKCPGNTSAVAVVGGGSSDEGTDDEQHSTTEKVVAKNVEDLTQAVPEAGASGVAVVGDVGVISREFSLSSAVQRSNTASTSEAGVPVVEKDNSMKTNNSKEAPEIAVGGLMSQQKDEADIWVCKECGWRYPNAKPSPKVRKNHKNKCPGKGGHAKSKDSRSSDDASSDDDKFKCFPCLL